MPWKERRGLTRLRRSPLLGVGWFTLLCVMALGFGVAVLWYEREQVLTPPEGYVTIYACPDGDVPIEECEVVEMEQ